MKRVTLIIAITLFLLPLASAQFIVFSSQGEILVLSGDYTEGTFILKNDQNFDFKIVSFRKYVVLDERLNRVEGFRLELQKTIYNEWTSGETREISYKLFVNESVKPGNYQIVLTFWGFLESGDIYIITAKIPVKVIDKPLIFEEAITYVKERPFSSNYVLNGETVVVSSHIKNLKNSIIPLKASTYLERNGKKYLLVTKTVNLTKGDNIVRFEIPIPYDLPSGNYKLVYLLEYPGGTYSFSKEYYIQFGVELSALSLKSTQVMEDFENEAYVTLTSERDIKVNVTLLTYDKNGELLHKYAETVQLQKGTNIVRFSLPSAPPGEVKVLVKVTYDGIFLGERSATYHVMAYPKIDSVTYRILYNGKVEFTVAIMNENSKKIEGVLHYKITAANETLYKGLKDITLFPGENKVRLEFTLPEGEAEYQFVLSAFGKNTIKEGTVYIEKQTPTQTLSSPSSSSTIKTKETTSQLIGGEHKEKKTWVMYLVGILIAAVLTAVLIGLVKSDKKKKRKRPRPKKKSPLGKYKRPKIPKFVEKRELPKKR
ncbi:COG1361 family protein [Thermococcus barophilus]|uniref:Uncharacterized protein n=1 Tax=Thermococcus barophilus (strain DSM 11836 / MP) TaxID=391623 RepID=F0LJK8_THEBM|nr:hypothetical protein [Thermococcus barophilus]ADT84650.1 hypothetical protein TERMP_01675 [Thermococcus barophilus MP]